MMLLQLSAVLGVLLNTSADSAETFDAGSRFETIDAGRPNETPDAGPSVASREELEALLVNRARTESSAIAGSEESRVTAPANIQIITYEQIAQRRYRSIAEALQDVPGLYVIDDLVIPSVGVRGITGGVAAGSRIIRVMINGVQVGFRADLTAFLGPEYLPIEVIERIEIAKGPLSALYGANAFLATVNIVTRKEGGGASVIADVGLRGRLVNGNPGFGGSAVAGLERGNSVFIIALSADYIDRSGLLAPLTFQAPTNETVPERYARFFSSASRNDTSTPVTGHLLYTYRGERTVLEIQGGVQRLNSGAEFQLNSVLTNASRAEYSNEYFSARVEHRPSDFFSGAVKASLSHGDNGPNQKTFISGRTDSYFRKRQFYRAVDGSLEATVVPTRWLSARLGVDGSYEFHQALFFNEVLNAPRGQLGAGDQIERIGPSIPRSRVLSNAGAYGLITSTLFDRKLVATVNGRVDLSNVFPAQVSWRASLAWAPTQAVTAKVVAGRAFQIPSATLLYAQPGFPTGNNIIGNLTTDALQLVPQSVTSIEAILSVELLKRFSVDVSFYGQQVDNFIDFRPTGNNFVALNITTPQRALGGEVAFNLVTGPVTTNGALAVQARDITSDLARIGAIDPLSAPTFPGLKGFLSSNLAIRAAHLNLNASVRGVGARYSTALNTEANNRQAYRLAPYATVDAAISTIGLSLFGGTETSFALSARNLLDTRFAEPGFGSVDIPNIGRTFLLEIREAF
jgi:outer membrane receptor protein involved in Fe transport